MANFMANPHLMTNSETLDLIKPSQVTRISAWSSETEDIIAAAVSVLINNGDNLRGEFDWDKIGAELGKKGMGTYDSYYWFRSMVHGRNAKIETSDGPTNRYPDSEALDDTGGILALKNTSELVSEATYRKVRLILGGKIRTFGNFIELNDESQN